MTVDQNLRSSPERAAHVLESGDIYFAYRPKIEAQAAKSFEDVARLYMILSPRGKQLYRFIIIGEKRLPAVSGGGDRKTWGFVEKVASRPEEVEDELDPETYPTKTRGERHLAAAPPPARECTRSRATAAIPMWRTPWSCRPNPVRRSRR